MGNADRESGDPLWRQYLRFWGPDVGADVDDELGFHLDMLEAEHVARGMEPESARRAARRRFGDYEAVERECVRIGEERGRMMRRAEWLDTIRTDIRFVFRTLWKNPGFTVATVLVLALGLGANTAIFSIADSVVLRPLPYEDADRLVRVFETYRSGGEQRLGSVSVPNFEDWRQEASAFEALAIAGYPESATLQGHGDPERLSVVPVGPELFSLLGARPLVGRSFAEADCDPGAARVAVLSEQAWRTRFGGDASAIGGTLMLNGEGHTVVGVMPEEFRYPAGGGAPDAWVPLRPVASWSTRGMHAYVVLGRLAAGVSPEVAQAELDRIAASLADEYPEEQAERGARLVSLHESVVGEVQPGLLVLLGAAGLVLLIACANAASLMLARATARRREVAIRTALGASLGRVTGQFLAESLTLAVLGAVAGLGLAWVAVRMVAVAAGPLLPRAAEIGIDARSVALLAILTLVTGVMFGLIPAINTSRTDLQGQLREAGRQNSGGRGAQRLRGALVVGQVALSVILLVAAGLLVRTTLTLLATDTGMEADQALTLGLGDPGDRYESDVHALSSFYFPVLERIRGLPEVEAAGLINLLPLEEWGNSGGFEIIGSPSAAEWEAPYGEIRVVTPGYFEAMGIPLRRGRDLDWRDDQGAPSVVLVNDALAERYFPGGNPVGQQIRRGEEELTIVGVVGSVRQVGLDREALPEFYLPYSQLGTTRDMHLVVRVRGEPMALAPTIVSELREMAPLQVVYDLRPMERVVAASYSDRSLMLGLVGAFAALAMTLAAIGIYGTISYSVALRTREFGIRLALGASGHRIRRMVVSYGLKLSGLGIALGLGAAYLVMRLLATLLYGVGTMDLPTYGAVALVVGAVTLWACYLPARRGSRVAPVEAMRVE